MEYLATLIPNSKLVVLEGSGHLPAMIRPVEVAALINEYFTDYTGPGPKRAAY